MLAGVLALGLPARPAAAQALFEQPTLTGDWGGARSKLQDAGVALGVTDIAETLSNPVGGLTGETIYDGQTDRKSTRLNSSHEIPSRMPSSA